MQHREELAAVQEAQCSANNNNAYVGCFSYIVADESEYAQ